MTKKVWTVNLEDGKHLVELEHGYFSGKKVIYVDSINVVLQHESVRSFLDSDSDHPIKIGDHDGILHIRTNGLNFSFDLSVDGYSISTGKQVPLSKPLPWWGWFFVGLCVLVPLISLGGALPTAIGFGGASICYGISKDVSKGKMTRLLMCVGITALCWALFICIILAIRPIK
jgi:hypothetical protein